jgi:hypothetical protein
VNLLTLYDVLHGGVVDVTGLGNNNLLLTMWWMIDVTLSAIPLRSGALLSELASTTIVEADIAGGSLSGWWSM